MSAPADQQSAARARLWTAGIVAPWYLREDQTPVYWFLHHKTDPFIEAGRRYGKTTTILCYVLEKLSRNPGWICRWVFPEKKTARTVIAEEMEKIQADCPEELRFKWRSTDSVYLGPITNGRRSKIFLYGVDKDKGKSLRGEASNIVVGDEFGFWSDPSVMERVLAPTLLTTKGQRIICSTPAEDPAHRYYFEYEKAVRTDRFIQRTIFDNESLTDEQVAKACEDAGGENSTTWKREYLCEHVTDPKKLVIPEYLDTLEGNVIPDDQPRPEFFTPYVSGDSGADDNTALVFGYYDFLKDEEIVEYELVINGQTTGWIVEQAKKIEKELWDELKPRRRVYDAPKQLIFDLFKDYKYPVEMPQKDDRLPAIHQFRARVGKRKFKVKESCVHTRRQLKAGMWTDERHLDFQRSEELGHLDAIAATIYFDRCIDRSYNPIPHDHGVSRYTHHISPDLAISRGSTEDRLARLVGGRTMRRR